MGHNTLLTIKISTPLEAAQGHISTEGNNVVIVGCISAARPRISSFADAQANIPWPPSGNSTRKVRPHNPQADTNTTCRWDLPPLTAWVGLTSSLILPNTCPNTLP